LGFITQEMGREINGFFNHAQMQKLVVQMKTVEKKGTEVLNIFIKPAKLYNFAQ
jgi:uncharacterized protein YicC (UPF0701 family)